MSFSPVSRYASSLSLSLSAPGGRPVHDGVGSFQPNTLEKMAISRSSADEQFDAAFIEQFRGAAQNRLNFLVSQLQQAYSALLQSTSASLVKDHNANNYTNGYTGANLAFAGIGGHKADGSIVDHDGDGLADIGEIGVAKYVDATYTNKGTVNFRSFNATGAAIDLKQTMGITMRSEETGAGWMGPLAPGFSHKVKEYSTTVSTGGFWTAVNYLYAWRPSSMGYEYLDGYSQNSDSAGFDGYLSNAQKTSGDNSGSWTGLSNTNGDYGDGTMQGQNGGFVKWQGGNFKEGYLATYNSKLADSDEGNTTQPDFYNTYYVRKRQVTVDNFLVYDLNAFAQGTGVSGEIRAGAEDKRVEDLNKDGFLGGTTGGSLDRLNGNMYKDPGMDDPLPGTGKIEEKFSGKWAESRYGITDYNGRYLAGNGANPIFGGFELTRLNVFYHPDTTLTTPGVFNGALGEEVVQYRNGVNMDPTEADKRLRLGQVRTFMSDDGGQVKEVDQRRNDTNSFQEFLLEILTQPRYRDIMRLGLFKDVLVNGSSNSPAGGMVNASIRMTYIQRPVWESLLDMSDRGRGERPGISAQLVVFQDKFVAKGA